MNKYVLLTGANGGLGNPTLRRLIKDGYKLICVDINDSNLKDLDCTFIKCDLSKKEEIDSLILKVKEITNTLYAIINLAGIFKMQSIIEGSSEDLKKIIDINFFATYYINKGLFDLLDKNSRIINISSEVARYSPQPFMNYYAMSKKMVDCYTDVLRRECNYIGIKVVKIQSGALKTNMLTCANGEYDKFVSQTKYFKGPLIKLKKMMDNELTKSNDPSIMSNLISKILSKNNPKIRYRIKNSFALRFVNSLPEKLQDYIYKKVIK